MNKEAAFANGFEFAKELWKRSRSIAVLGHIQSPLANSKPFANAASLFKFYLMFVQVSYMRKGYDLNFLNTVCAAY